MAMEEIPLSSGSLFFGTFFGAKAGSFADELTLFLLEVLLVGLIVYFVERIRPAEPRTPFFKKDLRNEFLMAFMNVGISQPVFQILLAVTIVSILTPVMPYQAFSETIQSWPLALQIALGCLVRDFSVYWRHRFTHYWMWSYHSVHHSAQQLTWLTSLRLHPVDVLAAMIFDTVILHLVGFDTQGIILIIVIMKFFNYFTHMNLDLKFSKPMRYIFASPNYHRWHHATVREAYDKNFCAAFPFLDLAFGTYYHPEDLPPGYGLSPREQANYPDTFVGWLAYPFKRDWKRLKKALEKRKSKKPS